MPKTFFFYDLETSGLDARYQRIMQFAGQRTNIDMQPIGEPINILVRLSDDILPEPPAVLVTGITPQKTLEEGISEAEFARMLNEKVFTPNTITTGFNNVRFDDEFIRTTLWRNFYDPYEWSWKDGRSRWDLLDVVRMTRALRPEGITWPVREDGKPTNRLELLSTKNGLEHAHAHDALSDVEALIGMAKLIKEKQPKLFEYLFKLRDKKEVAKIVNLENPQPFVYSSGRYSGEFQHTTIAFPVAPGARAGSVLVYDLRINPDEFSSLSSEEIKKTLFAPYKDRKKDDFKAIPVKEMMYNRCPAVAPLGVISDKKTWQNIDLNQEIVEEHLKNLQKNQGFIDKVAAAFAAREAYPKAKDVEGQLYDSFMQYKDKPRVAAVRNADEKALADFHPDFIDERLSELLLRYKARNFPHSLNKDEQDAWEIYKTEKFKQNIGKFSQNLMSLSQERTDEQAQFLLKELQFWAENIAPIES